MRGDLFIVGGGPSLTGFDFERLRGKTTLGVNMAVFDIPEPNYFITIDYIFFRKCGHDLCDRLFNMDNTHKAFIANFASGHLRKSDAGAIYDKRYNKQYKLLKYMDEVIVAKHIKGVGADKYNFCSGRNSGFCAVQYGLIEKYKNIYLLGIDLSVKRQGANDYTSHYHDRYNNSNFRAALNYHYGMFGNLFNNYKKLFPNQNIYSCSPANPHNGKTIEYVDMDTLI